MGKTNGAVGNRSGRMYVAIGLLAVAAPVLCALVWATPGVAHVQGQSKSPSAAAAATVTYEYEVVSIKPNKSGSPIPGGRPSDDGIDVTNFPLTFLVQGAFGVGNDRIVGLPSWVATDRFDINAKMDPATADALKKMSADDRKDVQQRMVQAIFVDRCKLTFHRETRELSTFTLVLGKNGPKFKESKPGDAPAEGFKVPDGKGGTGTLQVGEKGLMTFHALPISFMVGILSQQMGKTIVDKTGLTGKYDFSWQFVPSAAQIRQFGGMPAESGPGGSSSGIPSDPDGTDLFTAVQEQLGLKLESGKGPIEVIVIDHMEKPSGN
jgi:bla regulator protein blaR1